jgi:hypothetical protein
VVLPSLRGNEPLQRRHGGGRYRTLCVAARDQFERLKEEHKRLAFELLEAVAKVLALRLRYADKELMAMQD